MFTTTPYVMRGPNCRATITRYEKKTKFHPVTHRNFCCPKGLAIRSDQDSPNQCCYNDCHGEHHGNATELLVANAILHGSYDLTLDEAHRLVLPDEVRRAIATMEGTGQAQADRAVVLFPGTNAKIWIYSARKFDAWMRSLADRTDLTDVQREFARLVGAQSQRVEWDHRGIIQLPEKLRRLGSLCSHVTLVGVMDHLELWNQAEWMAKCDALDAKLGEIVDAARRAGLP
jgi:MraZ protein